MLQKLSLLCALIASVWGDNVSACGYYCLTNEVATKEFAFVWFVPPGYALSSSFETSLRNATSLFAASRLPPFYVVPTPSSTAAREELLQVFSPLFNSFEPAQLVLPEDRCGSVLVVTAFLTPLFTHPYSDVFEAASEGADCAAREDVVSLLVSTAASAAVATATSLKKRTSALEEELGVRPIVDRIKSDPSSKAAGGDGLEFITVPVGVPGGVPSGAASTASAGDAGLTPVTALTSALLQNTSRPLLIQDRELLEQVMEGVCDEPLGVTALFLLDGISLLTSKFGRMVVKLAAKLAPFVSVRVGATRDVDDFAQAHYFGRPSVATLTVVKCSTMFFLEDTSPDERAALGPGGMRERHVTYPRAASHTIPIDILTTFIARNAVPFVSDGDGGVLRFLQQFEIPYVAVAVPPTAPQLFNMTFSNAIWFSREKREEAKCLRSRVTRKSWVADVVAAKGSLGTNTAMKAKEQKALQECFGCGVVREGSPARASAADVDALGLHFVDLVCGDGSEGGRAVWQAIREASQVRSRPAPAAMLGESGTEGDDGGCRVNNSAAIEAARARALMELSEVEVSTGRPSLWWPGDEELSTFVHKLRELTTKFSFMEHVAIIRTPRHVAVRPLEGATAGSDARSAVESVARAYLTPLWQHSFWHMTDGFSSPDSYVGSEDWGVVLDSFREQDAEGVLRKGASTAGGGTAAAEGPPPSGSLTFEDDTLQGSGFGGAHPHVADVGHHSAHSDSGEGASDDDEYDDSVSVGFDFQDGDDGDAEASLAQPSGGKTTLAERTALAAAEGAAAMSPLIGRCIGDGSVGQYAKSGIKSLLPSLAQHLMQHKTRSLRQQGSVWPPTKGRLAKEQQDAIDEEREAKARKPQFLDLMSDDHKPI